MVRAEEKLHDVISSLQDQVNNWDHRGIKKITLENMINDLEIVDEELHDLKLPPITDDIKLDNKVCLFYIINELKDIITEPNVEDVEKRLTDFHNTLVFNLGINALNNHKNEWEDK